jgi:hypothetical protein
MLGDEHRMPAPGRLLAVVERRRRGKTLPDKVAGMGNHGREPALPKVRTVFLAQAELRPEPRGSKLCEDTVEIAHIP